MSSCSGTMTSSCSCLRRNKPNQKAVVEFPSQLFDWMLSNTETYICCDRYRRARGVRIAADGIRRCNCCVVKQPVPRRGGDRHTCNIAGGTDRRDNRCRTLKAALHRHVGVLLVRVDRRPETVGIKRCAARSGHVAVARALTCTRAGTYALSVTCAIAAARARA